MGLKGYKEKILEFSKALVQCQKPIRILDAVKWDQEKTNFFFKTQFKEIPKIDREYYSKQIPLGFDSDKKIEEFKDLRLRVEKSLGKSDPLGAIIYRNCKQYEDVVKMLKARGTKDFYKYSKNLFGSPKDFFRDGVTTVHQLGAVLGDILNALDGHEVGAKIEKDQTAEQVVSELNLRLAPYFKNDHVMAKLDDGILSDAAAGSDYIKIKRGTMFSRRDIDVFEVHEGWVHVGTTINGLRQSCAQFLAKGPPCTTAIQEGLAVTMEVMSFVSTPERTKRINRRLIVCEMAENGANILDIIEYFRNLGQSDIEAFKNAQRAFRGGLVEGGAPFTKDISYCKGFVNVYNFIRLCIRLGKPEYIPFLFCGKVTLEDIPVLYEKSLEGIVDKPLYLPKQFSDLNGLAVWMAFSNFLNLMNLNTITENILAPKKSKKAA